MNQQMKLNNVLQPEGGGKPAECLYGPVCDPRESIDGIDAWDKFSVAELNVHRIDHMTCEELILVIHAAEFSALFRSDLDRHIEFLDRETLQRLAHLARQCCRNQGY